MDRLHTRKTQLGKRSQRRVRERKSLPVQTFLDKPQIETPPWSELPRMNTSGFVVRESTVRPIPKERTRENADMNQREDAGSQIKEFLRSRKQRPRVAYIARKRATTSRQRDSQVIVVQLAREWGIKAAACVLVALTLWGMSRSEWDWAGRTLEAIQMALGDDTPTDELLGRLKLVRNSLPEEAVEALSPATTQLPMTTSSPNTPLPTPVSTAQHSNADTPPLLLAIPLEGRVLTGFGTTLPDGGAAQGIQIEATAGAAVKAGAAGRVIAIEEDASEGNFCVKLSHEGGWQTWYTGLSQVLLRTGDAVASGQQLGSMSQPLWLYVELYGRFYDPLAVLDPDYIRREE